MTSEASEARNASASGHVLLVQLPVGRMHLRLLCPRADASIAAIYVAASIICL